MLSLTILVCFVFIYGMEVVYFCVLVATTTQKLFFGIGRQANKQTFFRLLDRLRIDATKDLSALEVFCTRQYVVFDPCHGSCNISCVFLVVTGC